jgi:hypothetical protein
MSDRFAGVPRGKAPRGSRAIAEYVLGDPDASEIVCSLPRTEFGLVVLGRDLIGYAGWLDAALAGRARTSKSRSRATSKVKGTEAAA